MNDLNATPLPAPIIGEYDLEWESKRNREARARIQRELRQVELRQFAIDYPTRVEAKFLRLRRAFTPFLPRNILEHAPSFTNVTSDGFDWCSHMDTTQDQIVELVQAFGPKRSTNCLEIITPDEINLAGTIRLEGYQTFWAIRLRARLTQEEIDTLFDIGAIHQDTETLTQYTLTCAI